MKRLIYYSAATSGMDPQQLDALLERSRAKNARLGITGALFFCEGSFMQVLEGPTAAVEALYATIAADERHAGHIVVLDEPVAERLFQAWAMADRRLVRGWQPVDDSLWGLIPAEQLGSVDARTIRQMAQAFLQRWR